jgi:hypothetical protein
MTWGARAVHKIFTKEGLLSLSSNRRFFPIGSMSLCLDHQLFIANAFNCSRGKHSQKMLQHIDFVTLLEKTLHLVRLDEDAMGRHKIFTV